MRLSMIFNPSSANKDNNLNKAVYTALTTLSGNIAKSFITKLVKEENVMEMKAGTKKLVDLEVHVSSWWLIQIKYVLFPKKMYWM